MAANKSLFSQFNNPDTLGIISSFPIKGGEIASMNAISRYTYLLSKSFPINQNIVIFCEKNEASDEAYLLSENILIIPSFKHDSISFAGDLMANIFKFDKVKDVLVQFEFSVFGGKKVIPSFLFLLLTLKLLNKSTSLVLHQVVTDLNDLSGHLGLSRNSLNVGLFNTLLVGFYLVVGNLSKKIICHDKMLKNRLSKFIGKSKISVIPHAVGDEKVIKLNSKLVGVAKKSFGFAKQDKVITVYGYRSWYKGTDWIVKTVSQLSKRYPKENLKLLVAGGVSPTLKNTSAYKSFDKKLKNVIKKANGSVVVTGFVPEGTVWNVFAASNVMVFPYRTRMSASGAFNLSLTYKKPFLVSNHFAEGLDLPIKDLIFDLNTFSFEGKLMSILKSSKLQSQSLMFAESVIANKSWQEVASLYLSSVKSDNILIDVNFKKDYVLVEA